MWTQLEAFQRLDSRLRGNDKQGGNDEGDAFPWSPYPKLGLYRLATVANSEVPKPPPKGFDNYGLWRRAVPVRRWDTGILFQAGIPITRV